MGVCVIIEISEGWGRWWVIAGRLIAMAKPAGELAVPWVTLTWVPFVGPLVRSKNCSGAVLG